jgi:hypothetical protein
MKGQAGHSRQNRNDEAAQEREQEAHHGPS